MVCSVRVVIVSALLLGLTVSSPLLSTTSAASASASFSLIKPSRTAGALYRPPTPAADFYSDLGASNGYSDNDVDDDDTVVTANDSNPVQSAQFPAATATTTGAPQQSALPAKGTTQRTPSTSMTPSKPSKQQPIPPADDGSDDPDGPDGSDDGDDVEMEDDSIVAPQQQTQSTTPSTSASKSTIQRPKLTSQPPYPSTQKFTTYTAPQSNKQPKASPPHPTPTRSANQIRLFPHRHIHDASSHAHHGVMQRIKEGLGKFKHWEHDLVKDVGDEEDVKRAVRREMQKRKRSEAAEVDDAEVDSAEAEGEPIGFTQPPSTGTLKQQIPTTAQGPKPTSDFAPSYSTIPDNNEWSLLHNPVTELFHRDEGEVVTRVHNIEEAMANEYHRMGQRINHLFARQQPELAQHTLNTVQQQFGSMQQTVKQSYNTNNQQQQATINEADEEDATAAPPVDNVSIANWFQHEMNNVHHELSGLLRRPEVQHFIHTAPLKFTEWLQSRLSQVKDNLEKKLGKSNEQVTNTKDNVVDDEALESEPVDDSPSTSRSRSSLTPSDSQVESSPDQDFKSDPDSDETQVIMLMPQAADSSENDADADDDETAAEDEMFDSSAARFVAIEAETEPTKGKRSSTNDKKDSVKVANVKKNNKFAEKQQERNQHNSDADNNDKQPTEDDDVDEGEEAAASESDDDAETADGDVSQAINDFWHQQADDLLQLVGQYKNSQNQPLSSTLKQTFTEWEKWLKDSIQQTDKLLKDLLNKANLGDQDKEDAAKKIVEDAVTPMEKKMEDFEQRVESASTAAVKSIAESDQIPDIQTDGNQHRHSFLYRMREWFRSLYSHWPWYRHSRQRQEQASQMQATAPFNMEAGRHFD